MTKAKKFKRDIRFLEQVKIMLPKSKAIREAIKSRTRKYNKQRDK